MGAQQRPVSYDPECFHTFQITKINNEPGLCATEFDPDPYSVSLPNMFNKDINYLILLIDPQNLNGEDIILDNVVLTQDCSCNSTITSTEIDCRTYEFEASQCRPDVTFSWNFNDPMSGANNTATGSPVTHAFSTNGTYTVTLTVSDVCGNTKTTTEVVSIDLSSANVYVLRLTDATEIGATGMVTLVDDGNGTVLPNFFGGCYNVCGTLDVNKDFYHFVSYC